MMFNLNIRLIIYLCFLWIFLKIIVLNDNLKGVVKYLIIVFDLLFFCFF